MRIDLKKMTGLGAVLAALAAGPAMAQGMSDWDSDGDGVISHDEFHEGMRSNQGEETTFSKMDENGDGMLSEEEFNASVFNSYDRDRSGMIEEPEFEKVDEDVRDDGFWKTL